MCEVTTYDAKTTQNMGGYSGTHIFDEGVNPFFRSFFYTKIIEWMVGTACKKRPKSNKNHERSTKSKPKND